MFLSTTSKFNILPQARLSRIRIILTLLWRRKKFIRYIISVRRLLIILVVIGVPILSVLLQFSFTTTDYLIILERAYTTLLVAAVNDVSKLIFLIWYIFSIVISSKTMLSNLLILWYFSCLSSWSGWKDWLLTIFPLSTWVLMIWIVRHYLQLYFIFI